MRAAVFHKPRDVRIESVDDPRLEASTDCIIRVTASSISGADLHIYDGLLPQAKPAILGRELMGIVVEVGRDATKVQPGDRVLVPATIACGRCWFCTHELTSHCTASNPRHYGPEGHAPEGVAGGVFGGGDLFGAYSGGQAELVRVPFADVGLRKAPDDMSDEQLLLLTDALPAAWSALEWAEPKGGELVVVFGCGPVGILAMRCAWLRGASRVIAVDRERYRLELAERLTNAEGLHFDHDDVVESVRAMTNGRGADIVVDAVGLEAHAGAMDRIASAMHLQRGSIAALRKCISTVRRGGVISIVGPYATPFEHFPLGQLFDKGVTLKMGPPAVHACIDDLLALVVNGTLRADDLMTHRLPLARAPYGYDVFSRRDDDCLKVMLTP
jgi:threonine dehydrogenase-like Zn-dependent dehydrogenase